MPTRTGFPCGRWKHILGFGIALTFWIAGRPHAEAAPESARGPGELASFLKTHCLRCHGAEKQSGKVAFHTFNEVPRPGSEIELWKRVLRQLESGDMPPRTALQPSSKERKQGVALIHAALEKAGHPRQGNEVDHDALFSGNRQGEAPALTEGRLWRLTRPAYESFFRERFKWYRSPYQVNSPWEMVPDARVGFTDLPSYHRIGEAELEAHLRNVVPLAREVMKNPADLPEVQALRKAGKSATTKQAEDATAAAFRKILQRDPSPEERKRYAGFVSGNLQQDDPETAAEQLLLAVFLHPEVFYRVELPREQNGREFITPHHLARTIAYALTDQGPDEPLVKAVAEGKLATRGGIRDQVIRIVQDPKIAKPRVLRFFQEYFGYTKAPDVFKDAPTLRAAEVAPDAGRDQYLKETWAEASAAFVRDTDWLILEILKKDRKVLHEILTTRRTYAATPAYFHPSESALQQYKESHRKGVTELGFFWAKVIPLALRVYEIEEIATRRDAWSPDRSYEMPEGHRMGILTHPSWLVSHSGNFHNDPIRRGKWIRERLLGQKVPDIPITVDAKLPDEPHKSLRERMRVTREAYCWKCHQHMDPLGLPFERYDHFGRYRETELGKPVDATGRLEGTGDSNLDGDVKDAADLVQWLAASERVEQVFVRHVFRYFVGRNETLQDGPVLVEAHRAYTQSGGSMRALMISILTSDAFLYRGTAKGKVQDHDTRRSKP